MVGCESCGQPMRPSFSFSKNTRSMLYCPKCTGRRALVAQNKTTRSQKVNARFQKEKK